MPSYKTYVITISNSLSEGYPPYSGLEGTFRYDERILSYWNYIPNVYCVKSYVSAQELAELFQRYSRSFFVAEINPDNVNGRLPKAAWEWFYEELPDKSLRKRG